MKSIVAMDYIDGVILVLVQKEYNKLFFWINLSTEQNKKGSVETKSITTKSTGYQIWVRFLRRRSEKWDFWAFQSLKFLLAKLGHLSDACCAKLLVHWVIIGGTVRALQAPRNLKFFANWSLVDLSINHPAKRSLDASWRQSLWCELTLNAQQPTYWWRIDFIHS